jgi:hypothetical protein
MVREDCPFWKDTGACNHIDGSTWCGTNRLDPPCNHCPLPSAKISETEEARGMQSAPAAQAISDSPHALNGVVPDCLSGLMSALRTYAKDVTGTFETSFDGEKKLKINMEIFFK